MWQRSATPGRGDLSALPPCGAASARFTSAASASTVRVSTQQEFVEASNGRGLKLACLNQQALLFDAERPAWKRFFVRRTEQLRTEANRQGREGRDRGDSTIPRSGRTHRGNGRRIRQDCPVAQAIETSATVLMGQTRFSRARRGSLPFHVSHSPTTATAASFSSGRRTARRNHV